MAGRLDTQRLGLVFQSRPDILEGIKSAADSPKRIALFNDIATFVHDLQNGPEPAAKRRRVDDGPVANGAAPSANGTDPSQEEVLLEVKEISVSVPQRKKFELCFTPRHLYARAPGTTAPAPGIVYAWEDIEYVFYLPVPEKAQVQHNYVLFPRGSPLSALKTSSDAPEPFVFTVPAAAPKQGTVGGSHAAQAAPHSDAYHTLLHWALRTRLSAASNPVSIVSPDPSKFHSAIPQSHRPKEKAVHVKGFRGSKDGYLFFLPNGILWGFKKPLLFIPLDRVAAVSYTSVLQRTFNMVVEVFVGDGEATEEVEFGMIDQADYEGIDESYVKRNRLQDRSMADARKAKLELAENMKGVKKEGEEEGGAAEQVSELEAAHAEDEQRLQDEEDELEEDYDPGSDGDSDGSGESSEEDSDEEGGEYDEEEDEEGEGEEEGEEEDEEMDGVKEEEVEHRPKVKREPSAGVTQAGLAAGDDELAGVPPGGDDEMELEEKFDVVG